MSDDVNNREVIEHYNSSAGGGMSCGGDRMAGSIQDCAATHLKSSDFVVVFGFSLSVLIILDALLLNEGHITSFAA